MEDGDVGRGYPLGVIDTDDQRIGVNMRIDEIDRRPLTQDVDRIGGICRRDIFDEVQEIARDSLHHSP